MSIEKDFRKIVIDNVKEQLGEYMPIGGMTANHLRPDEFARLLCRAVQVAVLKGCEGSSVHAVPLAAFRYRDGEHQMLTATIILADDDLKSIIEGDEVFSQWQFRASSWDDVYEVNVPDLSQKERYLINGLISSATEGTSIHERMPFRLDRKDEESLALLENYLQHYRRYPTFSRVQSSAAVAFLPVRQRWTMQHSFNEVWMLCKLSCREESKQREVPCCDLWG